MSKMVYGALESSLRNNVISKYYYCKGCNSIIYREVSTTFSYCINADRKIALKEVDDFSVIQIFRQLKRLSND